MVHSVPSPPVIGAKSYLVIDATTDFEIAALDPDLKLPPASITKLMTAYVVFQALKSLFDLLNMAWVLLA